MTYTAAEKTFLNRVAFHTAKGMGFEAAGRQVLADDARICNFVLAKDERGEKTRKAITAEVYYAIKRDDAVARAFDAPFGDKLPNYGRDYGKGAQGQW